MGARFDWTLLAGRRFARPWFLAGGLDRWNVAEAVARVRRAAWWTFPLAWSAGAGVKDPALITAFLDAVAAALKRPPVNAPSRRQAAQRLLRLSRRRRAASATMAGGIVAETLMPLVLELERAYARRQGGPGVPGAS